MDEIRVSTWAELQEQLYADSWHEELGRHLLEHHPARAQAESLHQLVLGDPPGQQDGLGGEPLALDLHRPAVPCFEVRANDIDTISGKTRPHQGPVWDTQRLVVVADLVDSKPIPGP